MSVSPSPQPPSPPRAAKRTWGALIVGVVALLVCAAWSFVAMQRLDAAVAGENRGYLERARGVFELVRAETQSNLRAQSRVLAEDPRLKTTLSTEGMDEATIADILNDLNSLRRAGFILILSPEGKVLAQSGAPELRGLDLSSSSIVKKAQGSADAVVGAWVIAGKVLDLALVAVHYDQNVIAYLVVGRTMDQELLTAVSNSTGVGAAVVMGERVAIAQKDTALTAVFERVAKSGSGDVIEVAGQKYLASVTELEETAQVRPRLVLVRALASTTSTFSLVRYLQFVPPLILLTVCLILLLLSGQRASRSAGGTT